MDFPQVCFENESFVVFDKPSGWLSVPSRLGTRDPRPCLSAALNKVKLYPVHRLDEEVSGLVLFAKTPGAHRLANQWFETRKVRKTYQAWTELGPQETLLLLDRKREFEWHSTLSRGKKRAYESSHGKKAITHAVFCEKKAFNGAEILIWRLNPLTGRSHQLRYELSHRGFPILGDTLYGARTSFLARSIALRAVQLDFQGCEEAAQLGLAEKIDVMGLETLVNDAPA
ncbi:MAG: RNA pseudouridine synthase [Bdellovibrionota bacterium]